MVFEVKLDAVEDLEKIVREMVAAMVQTAGRQRWPGPLAPCALRRAALSRAAAPASGGAPWGGACLLWPLALLRLPVSAAGGGRLCSCLNPSSCLHAKLKIK